eukprot:CAMPEP_0180714644 /NCGR_PEP_ID=MMETSP1038_2-20121128/12530_1 /TAXON_ID=632150 /ORGANISM="Azadinium spinosum, Strain 3D9" /LENGTH=441 /DNA_ID=CAMNT_0022747019 /DNA_START=18 /DNA_END=1339 /DNA_ORIENTATION=+
MSGASVNTPSSPSDSTGAAPARASPRASSPKFASSLPARHRSAEVKKQENKILCGGGRIDFSAPTKEVTGGHVRPSESLLQQAVASACSEAVAAACGEVQAVGRREVEHALMSLLGPEACRVGAFPDCLSRLSALEAQNAVHGRQLEELMAAGPRGSPGSQIGGDSDTSEISERRLVSMAVTEACAALKGESQWWHREVVRLDSEVSKISGRIDVLEGHWEEAVRRFEVEEIRAAAGQAGTGLPNDVVVGLSQHLQVLQSQTDALQAELDKETADMRRCLGEIRRQVKVKSLEEDKLSQSVDSLIKKVDKTCSVMTTSSVDNVSRFITPHPEVLAQKAALLADGPQVQVAAKAGRNNSPQRNDRNQRNAQSPQRNHSPQSRVPVPVESGSSSAISAVNMGIQVAGDTPQLHALAEASAAMRRCQSQRSTLQARMPGPPWQA